MYRVIIEMKGGDCFSQKASTRNQADILANHFLEVEYQENLSEPLPDGNILKKVYWPSSQIRKIRIIEEELED